MSANAIDHTLDERTRLDSLREDMQQQMLADIRKLQKHVEFRRFVAFIYNMSGLFSSCMTGNSWTYFNEGRQAIGQAVFRYMMSADPEMHEQIVRDYHEFYTKQKGE